MFEFLQKLLGGAAGAGAGGQGLGGILGAIGGAKPGEPLANGMQGPTPMPQHTGTPSAPQGILGGLMSGENSNRLIDMGAAMMSAGAPSLDPKSGSFMGALGQGMGAMSAGGRADQEAAMKAKLVGAQTGNYEASTAQNMAQAELLGGQAKAMGEGMPMPGGAAISANPNVTAPTNAAPVGAAATAAAPTAAPAAPAAPTGPQPGQGYDGFRFKGGNPNDPAAWEKV